MIVYDRVVVWWMDAPGLRRVRNLRAHAREEVVGPALGVPRATLIVVVYNLLRLLPFQYMVFFTYLTI